MTIDIDALKQDKRPQSSTIVHALIDRLEAAEKERDAAELMSLALRAKIAEMEKQEPVAWMDRHGTLYNSVSHVRPSDKPLYALPGAQPAPSFADAYQGAMEEVAIWKKRALEAEDLNRKFVAEINGPTYMGEPAQPAPSVPEGWQLVPTAESRHPGIYKMLGALHAADNTPGMSEWESYRAMLAAAPEAKP